MTLKIVLDLKKVFSDSARRSALEARRRKAALKLAQQSKAVEPPPPPPGRVLGDVAQARKAMDDGGYLFKGSDEQLSDLEKMGGAPIEDILNCALPMIEAHEATHTGSKKRSVELNRSNGAHSFLLSVSSEVAAGKVGGHPVATRADWKRVFFFKPGEPRSVYMSLFFLPNHMQGGGVGKEVFRRQIALFDRMRIDKLKLQTAWVGSYAWLRHGYVPNLGERADLMHLVAEKSREMRSKGAIDDSGVLAIGRMISAVASVRGEEDWAKAIWAMADSKYGKELFMNSGWAGTLNFKKGSLQRDRLENYVGFKG